jgi:aerobic-type carbon monoxide dehydrogenase small subunit (CoxS/CutS family)
MPALNINGRNLEFEADPATPLLWVLREQLGLHQRRPQRHACSQCAQANLCH